MKQFQTAEYTEQVMAAAELIHQALGKTEFNVATCALMTVLAQAGKQSTLTTEEFLTVTVAQVKHLMDHITVIEHPIQ